MLHLNKHFSFNTVATCTTCEVMLTQKQVVVLEFFVVFSTYNLDCQKIWPNLDVSFCSYPIVVAQFMDGHYILLLYINNRVGKTSQ